MEDLQYLMESLQKTNSLLEETMKIVKEDRELARNNYDFIREKGEADDYISDDGALERELNNALKQLITSSDKLTKVADTAAKMAAALIRSDTLKEINKTFEDRTKIVDLSSTDEKNNLIERERNRLISQDKGLAELEN